MLLDDGDPTGAARLRQWTAELRELGPERPPRFGVQRLMHPGIEAASGDGLVAAQPLQFFQPPGEDPQAISLLHFMYGGQSEESLDIHRHDAMLGALLTVVTDRRCQIVPELVAKVENQENSFLIPITGQVDSVLSAPLPPWGEVDLALRDVIARLSSLDEEDAAALSAAIHMHYCSTLLLPRDLTGAYALVVGGLEALAQHFGAPPSGWADWDKAKSWDDFIEAQGLNESQAQALRARLTDDVHMRLAETFATYVSTRLPDDFWEQPVQMYTWQIEAGSGNPLGGTWSEPQPRDRNFAGDRQKVKRALKKAYQARSQFLHAGKRTLSFTGDLFGDDPEGSRSRLSMAQARAALRTLILLELSERGDPDPKGLDGIKYVLGMPSQGGATGPAVGTV